MRRTARTAALLLAAVVLAAGLTSCSSPPPPPRTRPNAIELAAVQETVGYTGIGNPNADVSWVQLWTVRQYPAAIEACAVAASHGQLQLDVGPLASGRLNYRNSGSNVHPTEAEAGDIIRQCQQSTPIDRRVLQLSPSQLAAVYSYDLTVLRPCLLSHGYPVGEVPSRSRFLALVRAQNPWSPYDHVLAESRVQWYAISDACPALPPIFGGQVQGG